MDAFLVQRVLTRLTEGGTGLFLRYVATCAAFAVAALLARGTPPRTRVRVQVVASIVLLAFLASPLLIAILVGYMVVLFFAIERLPAVPGATAIVIGLVSLQVIGPIWLLPALPGYEGRVREYVAFATNLTLLRSWSFAWDRRTRTDPETPELVDFLHFMFFLPSFMAGPLVSLDDFRRGRLAAYWGDAPSVDWRGLGRVAAGIVAMAVAFGVVCLPGTASYDAAVAGGPADAWLHVARVWVCIYLGLTTWTEGGIGFGRLAGFRLPENLDRPFGAYGVADFWRRWNMTLNVWTRRYIYMPLGGAAPRRRSGERRPEWRNTLAVFAFMAVYHLAGGVKLLGFGWFPVASYAPWLIWGVWNGLGVLATRRLGPRPPGLWPVAPVVVLTGAYCAVGIMTAFFPPRMDLAALWTIYRRLLGLP